MSKKVTEHYLVSSIRLLLDQNNTKENRIRGLREFIASLGTPESEAFLLEDLEFEALNQKR